MDVTFTTKFDAKRYARAVRRALAFSFRGATIFSWCMLVMMFGFVFNWWLGGCPEEGRFLWLAILFFGCYPAIILRSFKRIYVRHMQQKLGDAPATCRITDKGYEMVCGDLVEKMPWQRFASHYHFVDDDTVSLMLKRSTPVMVLSELREHGVDRGELEAAFRAAGLLPAGKMKKRRVVIALLAILGAFMVLYSMLTAFSAVVSCRNDMRFDDTQIRLFDLIHGKDDPRRPSASLDAMRARVVRKLADVGSPDEFIYVFDLKSESDKVGLLARYGDWSCEAYYPCGCVCDHYNGYWESLKTNHASVVYFEPDKEKWLEKIRPLAKDLYEKDEDE